MGVTLAEDWARVIALGETMHVDFKCALEWEGHARGALAEDIVAMANIRDGGMLLIGVAEGTDGGATIEGMTAEQAATFDSTKVGDYLASHFEPSVKFTTERATIEGKLILIIRVQEFEATPIVCIKDGPEKPSNGRKSKRYFYAGNVLVRNAAARSESIRTAQDMLAMIRLAVSKTSDQLLSDFRRVLDGGTPAARALPHERELAEWMRAREYYQAMWSRSWPAHGVVAMALLPSPIEASLDHATMRAMVQQSQVDWHGWSLPTQTDANKHATVQNRATSIESALDLYKYQELWQLHASGAFMSARILEYVGTESDQRIPFEEVILLVTLGVWFAQRLYERLIPNGQVELAFQLLGTKGQRLGTYDNFMLRLSDNYRAGEDVIESRVSATVLDLRSAWRPVVHRIVKQLFVLFNWDIVPAAVDQRLDEFEGKRRY